MSVGIMYIPIMVDKPEIDRREYLSTFGSIGAITLLAGCTSQQEEPEQEDTEEFTDTPTSTPTETDTEAKYSYEDHKANGFPSTSFAHEAFVESNIDFDAVLRVPLRNNEQIAYYQSDWDKFAFIAISEIMNHDQNTNVFQFETPAGAKAFKDFQSQKDFTRTLDTNQRGEWLGWTWEGEYGNVNYEAGGITENILVTSWIPGDRYSKPWEALRSQIAEGGKTEEYGREGYSSVAVSIFDHYSSNVDYSINGTSLSSLNRHNYSPDDLDKATAKSVFSQYGSFPDSNIESSKLTGIPIDQHTGFKSYGETSIKQYGGLPMIGTPGRYDNIRIDSFGNSELMKEYLPGIKAWGFTAYETMGPGTAFQSYMTDGALIIDYASSPVSVEENNIGYPNPLTRYIVSGNTVVQISYSKNNIKESF